MKKPFRTIIKVINHQYSLERLKQLLDNLLDGNYTVMVEKQKNKRTTQQNRYLWLYYNIISDDTGETSEEMHELFKRKFLPAVSKTMFNIDYKVPNSTTGLSKGEFSQYIESIERLTGIPSPSTEEYLYN